MQSLINSSPLSFILHFSWSRYWGYLLAAFFYLGCNTSLAAININQSQPTALGMTATYFKEEGPKLSLAAAVKEMKHRGHLSDNAILSFGINANPIWLKLEVDSPDFDKPDVDRHDKASITRHLRFETSWLDKIDLYFLVDNELKRHVSAGDNWPFKHRQYNDRFIVVPYEYTSDITDVYIRIETEDPLIIPLYLYNNDELVNAKVSDGYIYGLIYGFLLALLAYNALLAFSLKSRRYLFYAQYLCFFLLMNASYTGHAYKWFWPESSLWQQWSNPILMLLFVISGLLFAMRFLGSRIHLPKLHKVITAYCSVLTLIAAACVLLGTNVALLYTAFIAIIPFSVLMIVSGAVALLSGMKAARYFLAATIFATLGAAYTSFTVSGVLAYSDLGFHAVEIGMLIEAVLFALALSHQFKISQEDKVRAEKLADIDQLTGLYNRRGFDKILSPIFSTAQRNDRKLSVLLLDIDHFKMINDQYGHLAGDKVITNLSALLLEEARTGDVVARWGGEEFILLLPETDSSEAFSLAERLVRRSADLTLLFEQQEILFTVSIGVASLVNDDKSFLQLLDKADHALYSAKESGRNRVCV